MAAPIRVLVVDDSALTRQILLRALAAEDGIEIAGVAGNGVEAIEKTKELKPDVVTLDIEMPVLSGLEALPFLIRETDARVVVLSSIDDPDTTYAALEAGAVDFVPKPRSGVASSIEQLAGTLVRTIRIAARIAPEKRPKVPEGSWAGTGPSEPRPRPDALPPNGSGSPPGTAVAIAASTGGPLALERLFSGLDASLPAAYLIVQHLPPGFTDSLAGRLCRVSDVLVRTAEDRMRVTCGCAYLAPAGRHMTVRRVGEGETRIHLEDGPPLHGVRPAGDPLLESVARLWGARSVGVVLTGMGADGVRGLGAVLEAGGSTLVQDEESSVVWGMPGAAFRAGVAQQVVPITGLAAEIRRAVVARRRPR